MVTVHICCAHLIRAVRRFCIQKLQLQSTKTLKSKGCLTFILEGMAMLIKCHSFNELLQVYSCFVTVLCSKQKNDNMEHAISMLHDLSKGSTSLCSEALDFCDDSDKRCNSTEGRQLKEGLRKNSDFHRFFETLTKKIRIQCRRMKKSSGNLPDNELYCPDFVEYLKRNHMALVPLWSGLMLCLHDEYETLQGRISNATAESWFNKVKNHILEGEKQLPPGVFVEKHKKYILAEVLSMQYTKDQKLYKSAVDKKTVKPDDNCTSADVKLENNVEVWKRKNNKRPGFNYFQGRNIKRRCQAIQKNAESAITEPVYKSTDEKDIFSPHKNDLKLAQSAAFPHQAEADFELFPSVVSSAHEKSPPQCGDGEFNIHQSSVVSSAHEKSPPQCGDGEFDIHRNTSSSERDEQSPIYCGDNYKKPSSSRRRSTFTTSTV
ncbi:hypothetical protein U1Q18_050452 [Sarracenia purpurea var. burkii]